MSVRKRNREEAATDQAQQAGPSKKKTPSKDTGAMKRDTLCHIDNYYIYNSSLYGVGGRVKTIAEAIIKNIRLVLFEPTTRLHK
jgi:hypothetical protein